MIDQPFHKLKTRFVGIRIRGPRGLFTGLGVGVGVATGVGLGIGVGDGVGSGVGVGVGSGVGVAVGAGVGVGVAVGAGAAAPDCAAFNALMSQPKSLPSVPADLNLESITRLAESRMPAIVAGKKLLPG